MKKIIYIDGGAGRVIAAIPALEKHILSNPDDDVKIVIPAWDYLLWGNPLLQDRAYNADTKGIFKSIFLDADVVITPEPYRVPGYYKQQLSLAQAFNYEINNTTDHTDLPLPKIYLSKGERSNAVKIISDIRQQTGKPVLIFQPFGRSARVENGKILDDSTRGLDSDTYLKLLAKLNERFAVVLFAEEALHLPEDQISIKLNGDLKVWSALINECNYFLGCDSVGQHMARVFNKLGTVLLGSTYAVNVTYPDWFTIIESPDCNKEYSPIRISSLDSHLADRLNDKCLNFDDESIDQIALCIFNHFDSVFKEIK